MTSFEIVNKIFNISSIFISNAVIEKNILGGGGSHPDHQVMALLIL